MNIATLTVGDETYRYYPVSTLPETERLPLSLRVLAENVLRCHGDAEGREQLARICEAAAAGRAGREVDFSPARVLFQDFTGVPVFVDFAAMRPPNSAARLPRSTPASLAIWSSTIRLSPTPPAIAGRSAPTNRWSTNVTRSATSF